MRENTVQMRPPRALWVPFELGRPFGAPDDAAFQHKVLKGVLDLLEAPSGPVLADFPDDPPQAAKSAEDDTGWACPVSFPPPPVDPDDLGAAVKAEIDGLAPWYAEALRQRGRSTVGVSGMAIADAADYAAAFLSVPPETGMAAARRLKSALEDLKSFYSEAATVRPGAASGDIADWLWRETALGQLMFALADALPKQDDEGLRYLAERSLVPRIQAVWKRSAGA